MVNDLFKKSKTLVYALTSMVLSLKYVMYSGPMYIGGLQVITKTVGRQATLTVIIQCMFDCFLKSLSRDLLSHSGFN